MAQAATPAVGRETVPIDVSRFDGGDQTGLEAAGSVRVEAARVRQVLEVPKRGDVRRN